MTRRFPFPRSLRGQLLLLLLASLVATQAVSFVLFVDERRMAVRAALGTEVAGRAANVVRLIEAASADLRPAILRSADSPLVRFGIDGAPALEETGRRDATGIAGRIRGMLGGGKDREVRVLIRALPRGMRMGGDPAGFRGPMRPMHRAMQDLKTLPQELVLSIALSDGDWLNVQTMFHRPPLQWAWPTVLSMALMAAAIIVVVWLSVRRIVGPMNVLAAGADRLGRGGDAQPLPVTGPAEIRRVTDAFNLMQERLTRFIRERTQMLAALGHDLRSPLTAMRIRLEMLEEDENREGLAATVDEMQRMVEATLDFAKGVAAGEPSSKVNLAALLSEVVSEVKTTGGRATVAESDRIDAVVRPLALKRALRNVIENAVRYGGTAHAALVLDGDTASITVCDEGPGIPQEEMSRVFEPFVRLEASRSLETGGTGLGLAIARTVIHAHGGEIRLENRPDCGLRVAIRLPVS